MKRQIVIISALMIGASVAAGCSSTMKAEPGPGQLGSGVKVLVDDGSCPAGQIKQVTGGNNSANIPRTRECIARPS